MRIIFKAEKFSLPFLFQMLENGDKNIEFFVFYFNKSMEKRKSL